MKIYAPVKDFNGLRNNVRFVNGVGETDNQEVFNWFKVRGYRVEKCEVCHENYTENVTKPSEQVESANFTGIQTEKVVEVDFDAMTPNELREWAKENGLGGVIKNTRNKEKLLELIRG